MLQSRMIERWVIGLDPIRYRPLMIACIIEKFSFSIACAVLYFQHRLAAQIFLISVVGQGFGIAFVIAYVQTVSWRQHEPVRPGLAL